MSIFKTTLSVESTDPSTPVKFTATQNNDLTNDIVTGKVMVDSNFPPTVINVPQTGAKGSYVYIKSSATNPKHTLITISSEGEFILSLSPGEYAVVPFMASYNSNLFATVTHGTAELEYLTGSRGEEIGESVLVRFQDPNTSTWKYFTLDAATGKPGPMVDTGVQYNVYPNQQVSALVNQKGYILEFYNNDNEHKFVFVGTSGQIISSEEINQNFNRYQGDGRANLITWYDGNGNGHAFYFDGDNLYTHDFVNIDGIFVDDNWDACAADGTFPVYIEGYNGGTQEAVFFVKGADKKLVKTTSNGDYMNTYTGAYANFVAMETLYNDGDTYLYSVEIYDTDGTLLKSVNFNEMWIDSSDFYFYGSGKMQIVYRDGDTSDLIFLNYNQLTGKLIGDDLLWRDNSQTYQVVIDTYRTGYSRPYRPESVAILLYYNEGQNYSYLLNQDTDGGLKVTYIINNDLEARNYTVPYTEDRYFAANYWYDSLFASNTDFILLSAENRTSGPLIATRFASGVEPTKFQVIPDLSVYNVSNIDSGAWIDGYIFGDYRYLAIRKNSGNGDRDVIVYDGKKVLDTISGIFWDDFSTPTEFNQLSVIDWNNENIWYFNTSTKKFVKLPTGGWVWDWDSPSSEGAQYPVGTGKTIITKVKDNTDSVSIWGRVITKGSAANEKELLKFGNQPNFEWYYLYTYMTTETIVLGYKEYYNSTWKFKVFDLNLNFLYEVDTEKTERWTDDYYGKSVYYALHDNNGNWTYYNFGKLLNSLDLNDYVQPSDYAFNNDDWF